MFGWEGLRGVFPRGAVRSRFRRNTVRVSNFLNAQLTDILSSMAAMAALFVWIKLRARSTGRQTRSAAQRERGLPSLGALHPAGNFRPALGLCAHPEVAGPSHGHRPLARLAGQGRALQIHWAGASGTACLLAALFSAVAVRMKPAQFLRRWATR